jgi:membrane fusion protein (multidrug efflux system)
MSRRVAVGSRMLFDANERGRMTRRRFHHSASYHVLIPGAALILAAATLAGCSTKAESADAIAAKTADPIAIATAAVESRAIDRYLRVTGSLVADAQAEVSAETAGRVIETPVERGTRVAQGALLIRISPSETAAQLQEAEANAAQIEARLGLAGQQTFDRMRVPDVMNAKASLELAEAEFNRMRALVDQKVISQSEFDQRRTQLEAARQSYQAAQNQADQSYRSLEAARARILLARKAVADTSVKAPIAGLVGERLVSVGDYVTRGQKVATVVRVDPLRVELTVPEQHVSLVKAGQQVRLTVDAYPGEEFPATIRFVSPALRSDQRALTVEAITLNADGRLKPGLFATALVRQPDAAPALLVPASAVETVAGTSRVYVVKDGKIEERIVTTGEKLQTSIEITSGVAKGDSVASEPKGRLTDGQQVKSK